MAAMPQCRRTWPLLFFLSACTHQGPKISSGSPWLAGLGLSGQFAPDWKSVGRNEAKLGLVQLEVLELAGANGRSLVVHRYRMESAAAAQELQTQKLQEFKSVYDPRIDPYFAIVTKETRCPDRFLPLVEAAPKKASSLNLVSAFANERNTIGACTEDLAQKRYYFASLTCGATFTQFEEFIPLSQAPSREAPSELRSLDCLP